MLDDKTTRDSDWVSRKAYDMIMEKLDAATLENQRLLERNRRLRRCLTKGSPGSGGLRIDQ